MRDKLLQKQAQNISNLPILIFKTKETSRHRDLKLKDFLKVCQSAIQKVPKLAHFATRQPILCLKRSRNLREILKPN